MEIYDIRVCVVLQNHNKHEARIYFEAGFCEQPETTISVSVLVMEKLEVQFSMFWLFRKFCVM